MILITGATGIVGREVVAQLVGAGEQVRALTRDPQRARFPAGVEAVQGDLTDPAALARAVEGVSKVYLFLGPDHGKALLDAARGAGVQQVVLLSSLSVEDKQDHAIARRHQLGEQAVRDSGLAWTFLRPGGFASNTYQWAPSIKAERTVRAPYVQGRMTLIDPRDIAAVATTALRYPGHEGQAYTLTGPEPLSVVDQVSILSQVLGFDIRLEELSEEAARQAALSHGVPPPVIDSILLWQRESVGHTPEVLGTVEHVTGKPARSFRDWASAYADAFR